MLRLDGSIPDSADGIHVIDADESVRMQLVNIIDAEVSPRHPLNVEIAEVSSIRKRLGILAKTLSAKQPDDEWTSGAIRLAMVTILFKVRESGHTVVHAVANFGNDKRFCQSPSGGMVSTKALFYSCKLVLHAWNNDIKALLLLGSLARCGFCVLRGLRLSRLTRDTDKLYKRTAHLFITDMKVLHSCVKVRHLEDFIRCTVEISLTPTAFTQKTGYDTVLFPLYADNGSGRKATCLRILVEFQLDLPIRVDRHH